LSSKISIVVISKDEPALVETLAALEAVSRGRDEDHGDGVETVVVDASAGRLDEIRDRFPATRWIAYVSPGGVRTTIPHQRNAGVSASIGEIVVFTDAGCVPREGWLDRLIAPILSGDEQIVCGAVTSPSGNSVYDDPRFARKQEYLDECPTINLAFRREVFYRVGGFDESFAYGSDIDFTWRARAEGLRIRNAPDAVVVHDWQGGRRQLRRAYQYGAARCRLYRKHSHRRRAVLRQDPILVAYPAFLVVLPLAVVFPPYLALLLIPLWRNRSHRPLLVLVDHLLYGLGALSELGRRTAAPGCATQPRGSRAA
jgi:glycosyltransferase involved in cell wall biosynthesis